MLERSDKLINWVGKVDQMDQIRLEWVGIDRLGQDKIVQDRYGRKDRKDQIRLDQIGLDRQREIHRFHVISFNVIYIYTYLICIYNIYLSLYIYIIDEPTRIRIAIQSIGSTRLQNLPHLLELKPHLLPREARFMVKRQLWQWITRFEWFPQFPLPDSATDWMILLAKIGINHKKHHQIAV